MTNSARAQAIERELLEALERAVQAKALSVLDRSRGGALITSLYELTRTLPTFLAMIRGERDTVAKLIELVAELLRLCTPEASGALEWVMAVPPGRAVEVRRTLNAIHRLMTTTTTTTTTRPKGAGP